jgi:hypothetical protein
MDAVDLLATAYRPLIALADDIDDGRGWLATRLPGWTVRDLLFHLASDGQRALVAFGTPSDQPADTDEVAYWSHWAPATADADAGRRGTRIIASAWSSVRGPAALYAETARAVLVIARRMGPEDVVGTQGHRLTVGSLLRTLTVEAGVHHLDLECVLPKPPDAAVLDEIRRVLDALSASGTTPEWAERVRARG